MAADSTKYVKLKRSDNCGFGFSILGGAGSAIPPIIYDVVDGSPAADSCQLAPGDIIWEVNGQEVLTFTTKEVLNCLRLSTNEVTLRLKSDGEMQEKVRQFLATPNNPEVLRAAITKDDLHGIRQIRAKKPHVVNGSNQSSPILESPPTTPITVRINNSGDNSEHSYSRGSSNHSISENGLDRTPDENDKNQQKHKKEDGGNSTSGVKLRSSKAVSPPLRTPTISPPLSEDESDIESLHSFHYSPKAIDMPSALRLAKRLYALDGFRKSDVSRHLSKNNEFSRVVAEEYLHYFDLSNDSLDAALRKFLDKFSLTGETQERERVLVHFSRHYLDSNPGTFNSQDAVHTLTCALMLLNTDLHGQNVGHKMTCNEFIENLADLNDGENFPHDVLKSLYHAIRNQPLEWATDDDTEGGEGGKGGKSSGVDASVNAGTAVGSNPFLAPPSGNGIIYKKGYIMRKCCTDPNGKKTAFGKRSWKMWFCVLQDLVLYLHKDEQGARRGPHPQLGMNAIRLHHALATRAIDYAKKEHVFRLQTADQAEYLLQTSDSKELQAWIDQINFVASSLSAPPLPGAVGSQRKFQRPLLPCSITKLNLKEQAEDHARRLAQLEKDIEDHKAHPPEKTARSSTISNYKEKEAYLLDEIRRYKMYTQLLCSRIQPSSSSSSTPGPPNLDADLPVFEAHPGGGDPNEGGDPAARVVPPPIPERARPSDSPEEMPVDGGNQEEGNLSNGFHEYDQVDDESEGFHTANEDEIDESGSRFNSLRKKKKLKSKGEREKMNLEKTKKKEKEIEKEEEVFAKEMLKKEKEKDKREKKHQDKERKDLEKLDKEKLKKEKLEKMEQEKQEKIDKKEQDKQEKIEKKEQDKKEKLDKKEQEKLEKEKNKSSSKKEDEKEIQNSDIKTKTLKFDDVEDEEEDPRIGTMNRLSALFKFNKLNTNVEDSKSECGTLKKKPKNQKIQVEEEEEEEGEKEVVQQPPPLPPRPPKDSPVRRPIGTKIDI